MKQCISLLLIVCVCFICLVSCGNSYRENEWYSEDKLDECLVSDLPAPSKEFLKNGASILVSFSNTEYEAYVSEVYEYLKGLHLKYLGTRGEVHNTLAGIGTTYYFMPADELSDFYVDGTYYFVYGNGQDENGRLKLYTLAIYDYQSLLLEYGSQKFYYNTEIVLREGGAAPLDGGYLLKYNPITYADDLLEFLYDGYAPSEAAVGERVTVRIHPVLDIDLVLYANGVRIERTHADSAYWEYTFVMTDEKVVITRETVVDAPPSSEPEVMYLSDFEKWLSSVTPDGILEIKMEQKYPSVYSNQFYRTFYRTVDRDVITDVLMRYQSTVLDPIHINDVPVEGGSHLILEFVLTDGSRHTIFFEAGYYKQAESVYYDISEDPSISSYETSDRFFSLNTKEKMYTAYTKDGSAIAELTELPLLEFDYYSRSEGYTQDMYTHYIETEIGRLYIVSETVFFFETVDEWIAPECFELQNGNFYELFFLNK